MIAFGCAITEPEAYRRYAEPGIRAAAEPGAPVFAFAAVGAIPRSYNLLLDAAQRVEDLEALVLVHAHAELRAPDLAARVREAFADPQVAVLGPVGANGLRGPAWWEADVVAAPGVHRYDEHGGGSFPAYGWAQGSEPPADVEAIDGFVMVLSPWAVHHLRFDEQLGLGFGFDVDLCLQARAAGRTVRVIDVPVTHHRSLDLVEDVDVWVEAHQQLARKWEGRSPGFPGGEGTDWEARARRAEAARESARAMAYSKALVTDAQVAALGRELERERESRSWRITRPLRSANRLRARRRARGAIGAPPAEPPGRTL